VKRLYVPPRLVEYGLENVPASVRRGAEELRAEWFSRNPGRQVTAQYSTLVDGERNYVRVSDSFCKLLGYSAEELIGKKYDYVTASKTNDIPTVFDLFKKLGYMHGLWIFVHRTGAQILVRHEAWLRPDSYIESNMELIRHLR
jgi:PAS domain S-box-containing protein